MDLKATFARAMRRLRHAQGLSQEELGEMSGLTRNYIGAVERGEYVPTLDTVEAIAKALEVDAPDMLRADEDSAK